MQREETRGEANNRAAERRTTYDVECILYLILVVPYAVRVCGVCQREACVPPRHRVASRRMCRAPRANWHSSFSARTPRLERCSMLDARVSMHVSVHCARAVCGECECECVTRRADCRQENEAHKKRAERQRRELRNSAEACTRTVLVHACTQCMPVQWGSGSGSGSGSAALAHMRSCPFVSTARKDTRGD